ncbi:MAG: hypothetical protein F9K47_09795 [Burkholderiales bacterium]|nr:MAG: hypothetical protein F9K47_09795 [Burkholderiales bacterium]
MKRKWVGGTALAILASAPFMSARGEFRVVEPSAPIGSESLAVARAIVHFGERRMMPPPALGVSTAPFVQVLKAIAPEGWRGFNKTGIAEEDPLWQKPVTWKADGRQWYALLDDLLVREGLFAELRWDSKEMTLVNAEAFAQAKALADKMLSARATPVPAATTVATKPGVVTPPVGEKVASGGPSGVLTFRVAAGEKLSEAVARTVKGQAYELAWDSSTDFVLTHAYQLKGSDLVELLRLALLDYGLSFKVHEGNRVVHVWVTQQSAAPHAAVMRGAGEKR